MECELDFAGFIVLQNKLKAVTTPIILDLKNAGIRTVMITGKSTVMITGKKGEALNNWLLGVL